MVKLIRSRLKLTPEHRRKLVSWVTILSFLGACLFMAFWKDTKKAEASAVSHVGFFMWPSSYISGDYVPATGKIYVNSGSNVGFENSHIFEFDPNPPYPITWRETQGYFSGNWPHYGATAGTIGGNVFWLGGYYGSGPYVPNGFNDIHKFTPTDTMERVGYLPEDRCLAADATYNGKIYMVGGKATSYGGPYYDNILSFDGQVVQVVGTLPFPRYNGDAAFSSDGKLLIFGGYNSNLDPLNDIIQFDPVTGQCTQIGTLPRSSGSLRVAKVGESIYVFIPGDSSNPVTEIYEFYEGELYLLSVTIPERLGNTCPIVVGSKIFLFGGRDPFTAETTLKIWMLDTTQIPPDKVSLTISQQGNTITLNWNQVLHATQYHIEHSRDGVNWTEIAVTPDISYTGTLTDPGKHYYRVRAENNGVYGEYSDVVTVIIKPSSPAGLQASVDGKTVSLSWQAVPDASSYIVQRSLEGNTWTQIAEVVSGTSYTDTNTNWNTSYYYRVLSKTSDGVTSDPSNAVQVTTSKIPAPTNLKASLNGTKVSLTWQPVSGASSYVVERSLDGRTWSAIATVTSSSYVDQNTQQNTVYYYRVRAQCSTSVSDPSNTVAVQTFEDPPPPPPVISGLTAVWNGDQVRVTWNRGQNQLPDGEIELWKQGSNGVWLPVKTLSDSDRDSFVWDDLMVAPGQNYRYELRYLGGLSTGYTWYKVAESGWATGERPLPAPGGLRLTVGQSSATVTWEAVSGATSYTVQYSTNGGTTWQSLTVTGTSANVPRHCIVRVRAGNHSRSQWSGNVTVP